MEDTPRRALPQTSFARVATSLPLRWSILVAYFGSASAASGVVGFEVCLDLGFSEDVQIWIIAALALAGAMAGCVMQRPLFRASDERRWGVGLGLGLWVAFVTLELAVLLVIVFATDWPDKPTTVAIGWVFAPLLASPIWLTAGPISGLAFVAFARPLERRLRRLI